MCAWCCSHQQAQRHAWLGSTRTSPYWAIKCAIWGKQACRPWQLACNSSSRPKPTAHTVSSKTVHSALGSCNTAPACAAMRLQEPEKGCGLARQLHQQVASTAPHCRHSPTRPTTNLAAQPLTLGLDAATATAAKHLQQPAPALRRRRLRSTPARTAHELRPCAKDHAPCMPTAQAGPAAVTCVLEVRLFTPRLFQTGHAAIQQIVRHR